MKKKILSIILALCIVLSVCAMPVGAQEAVDVITVTVDGKAVDCNAYGQLPVIVEGRTLVPLRAVFEALGATVDWNNDTRTVTSVRGEVGISLAVDSTELVVNGEVKIIDVPAQIMNDRTMVPVRAIAEAFGCKVDWNNDTRTVVIASYEEDSPEDVVKKAFDAIFALDFEKAYSYFENAEAAMGEYASWTDVTSVIVSVSDEDLTEEQSLMVGDFVKKILKMVSYEITDCTIDGDTAVVGVKVSVPDLESINDESYVTEEDMLIITMTALTECGYTLSEIANLANITDEAELEKITNAITATTFDYIADKIIEDAAGVGKIEETDVVKLTLKDGKWLIVEETAEVTVTLYATDGRTISVLESEVDDYLGLGWYETEYEAQVANEFSNIDSSKLNSNNPTADGYFYRTPSGKKYHLDPNCGGKNSFRTTDISGLTPCSKCAE